MRELIGILVFVLFVPLSFGAMSIEGNIDSGRTIELVSPTSIVSFNNNTQNVNETDPLSLHLNQSTPQTVTNGAPIFNEGLNINSFVITHGTSTFYSDSLEAFSWNNAAGDKTFFLIDPTGGGIVSVKESQLRSEVATGTSPFAISSTTLNTNLNADLLDGHHYENWINTTVMNYTNIAMTNTTNNFTQRNNFKSDVYFGNDTVYINMSMVLWNGAVYPSITFLSALGTPVGMMQNGLYLLGNTTYHPKLFFVYDDGTSGSIDVSEDGIGGTIATYDFSQNVFNFIKSSLGANILTSLDMGGSSTANAPINLYGTNTSTAAIQRGGLIRWYFNSSFAGTTNVNSLGWFTWGNVTTPTKAGMGNAGVNFATGDATFKITNVTNLNVNNTAVIGGNLTVAGNLVVIGNMSVKRPYLSAYCNYSQPLLNASAAQIMNVSNNIVSNYLITVSSNMQNITFSSTGVYLITVSPEFFEPTGQSGIITFWFRQNGTDVPWSNSRYTLASNSYNAPEITYEATIRNPSTETIQVMWWSDNANTVLYASGALTSPARPSIPSVILTVRKSSEVAV